MWFLFHRKAQTQAVAGGRELTEHCPSCEKRTRFVEVEVTKKYGVWFVDVLKDRETAFRCTKCGEVYELEVPAEERAQLDAAAKAKAQMDRVEELAAEQRRRDAAKVKIAAKIDDDLAELKKRMGK